jgi:hypothetical protein
MVPTGRPFGRINLLRLSKVDDNVSDARLVAFTGLTKSISGRPFSRKAVKSLSH